MPTSLRRRNASTASGLNDFDMVVSRQSTQFIVATFVDGYRYALATKGTGKALKLGIGVWSERATKTDAASPPSRHRAIAS
jgi:hypothetical protein